MVRQSSGDPATDRHSYRPRGALPGWSAYQFPWSEGPEPARPLRPRGGSLDVVSSPPSALEGAVWHKGVCIEAWLSSWVSFLTPAQEGAIGLDAAPPPAPKCSPQPFFFFCSLPDTGTGSTKCSSRQCLENVGTCVTHGHSPISLRISWGSFIWGSSQTWLEPG